MRMVAAIHVIAIVAHLQVCGVAFSQGGNHFASCSQEGSLAVFFMETMEQMVLLQAPKKVEVWNCLL